MNSFTLDFNSHAHVERDDENIARINLEGISTHTLTWSVTCIFIGLFDTLEDFNSHAHVERDLLTQ